MERHVKLFEEFVNEANSSIPDLKSSIKDAQNQVKGLYGKSHGNFTKLPALLKDSMPIIKQIEKAFKDYTVTFSLDSSWYDKRTKGSFRIEFGIPTREILANHEEEWKEFHKQWKYTTRENWVAGKIAEIAKSKGVDVKGGSSQYGTGRGNVWLIIKGTEID